MWLRSSTSKFYQRRLDCVGVGNPNISIFKCFVGTIHFVQRLTNLVCGVTNCSSAFFLSFMRAVGPGTRVRESKMVAKSIPVFPLTCTRNLCVHECSCCQSVVFNHRLHTHTLAQVHAQIGNCLHTEAHAIFVCSHWSPGVKYSAHFIMCPIGGGHSGQENGKVMKLKREMKQESPALSAIPVV